MNLLADFPEIYDDILVRKNFKAETHEIAEGSWQIMTWLYVDLRIWGTSQKNFLTANNTISGLVRYE